MASSFKRDVEKFSEKFGISVGTVLRATTLKMYKDTFEETPRRTGRAQNSWNLTINRIDSSVVPPAPKGRENYYPHTPKNIILPKISKPTNIYYISNNLPYIVELSRGSSKQAAGGWFQRIIARWKYYIRDQVKQVKK
jgi:hypothetical protein